MIVLTVLAVAMLLVAPLCMVAGVYIRQDRSAQPDSLGMVVWVVFCSPYLIWEMIFEEEYRPKWWDFLIMAVMLVGCTTVALHLAGHGQKVLSILGLIYWVGMLIIWLIVQWMNKGVSDR